MSIGEFARQSRLSQKALRLYDELDVLSPARVDPDSGYRFYEEGQLDKARLIATLRQIGFPLALVKVIIDLEPGQAADQVALYWATAEQEHEARRDLAGLLVDRLQGKEHVMYEVTTREIPFRNVLCLERHVDGWGGAWAFGKEFVGILKSQPLALMEGIAGAMFSIYHGEVNEDSDGPVEWCLPVPEDHMQEMAALLPELTLRTEAAHEEAVVHLGPGGENGVSNVQWQLVTDSLHAWVAENKRAASDLGVRLTYLAPAARTAKSGPDIDFAVPVL